MDRKIRHKFETPQFSYGAVEEALGTVFGLDREAQQGPLRGRLKRLQQLGLPGLAAGKGARVDYSLEQAAQWLVALLMAELGLDPVVIVKGIRTHWNAQLARQATDAEALTRNPIMLVLRPRLMSDSWKTAPQTLPWFSLHRRDDLKAADLISSPPKLDAPTLMVNASTTGKQKEQRPSSSESRQRSKMLPRAEGDWFCVRNLTEALHKLETALHTEG
jgi:hypothetical protein